jgi:hypothetical protein
LDDDGAAKLAKKALFSRTKRRGRTWLQQEISAAPSISTLPFIPAHTTKS